MHNPAVVFTAPHCVAIEDRGPLTPATGQVVIENTVSLISPGTELTLLHADSPPGSVWADLTSFPAMPGYCSVGRVTAVGEGVDDAWLGARVSSRAWEGHARYMRASTDEIRRIHRGIPDEQAVFCTIAEIVINGVRRAQPWLGETAVVFGLGLLGQLCARILRLSGCRPVLAVDVEQSRLDHLPEDKMLLRLNPSEHKPVDFLKKQNNGRLADLAFEVTGSAALIPDEFAVLREQSRMVMLSSPRGETAFDFHNLCNRKSVTIIGAHTASAPATETPDNPWTGRRNAELFFDLIADGELDVTPLISHHESGLNAPELYAQLLDRNTPTLGVLLDWRQAVV